MEKSNKKVKLYVYAAFGLVVLWLLVAFLNGTIRGVFSVEGKDRLSARLAATQICAAMKNMDQPYEMTGCPGKLPCAPVEKHLMKARDYAKSITDQKTRDSVMDAVNSFGVIYSGKLSQSFMKHLVAEPLEEFLK